MKCFAAVLNAATRSSIRLNSSPYRFAPCDNFFIIAFVLVRPSILTLIQALFIMAIPVNNMAKIAETQFLVITGTQYLIPEN